MSDLFGMSESAIKELDNLNRNFEVPKVLETKITREVRKLRDAVEDAKRQLTHSKISNHDRLKLNLDIREAAAEVVRNLVAEETDRLRGELDKERKKIERDKEINSAKWEKTIRDAERRYAAMSEAEIRAEAMKIAENPAPYPPEILDIVSVNLKSLPPVFQGEPHDPAIPSDHAGFRRVLTEGRYYETERFTENGKRIAQTLDALSSVADGNYVPLMHEDGSLSTIPLSTAIGEVV